jgi:hypothetical protein
LLFVDDNYYGTGVKNLKRALLNSSLFFITFITACGNPALLSPFSKKSLSSETANGYTSAKAKCSKFGAPQYWNYLEGTLTVSSANTTSLQIDISRADSSWMQITSRVIKFSKVTNQSSPNDPAAPFKIMMDGQDIGSQDSTLQQMGAYYNTGFLPAYALQYIYTTKQRYPQLVFDGMNATDALKISFVDPYIGTLDTLVLRPEFEANPDIYKTSHSPELFNVHPFHGYIESLTGRKDAYKAHLSDVCL